MTAACVCSTRVPTGSSMSTRHLALVGLRHQLELQVREQEERQGEERGADREHRRPVTQRLAEEPRVAVVEGVERVAARAEQPAR